MANVKFKLDCPKCDAEIVIRSTSQIGQKTECPKCKYRFTVPDVEDDEDGDADETPKGKGKGKGKKAEKAKGGGKLLVMVGVGVLAFGVLAFGGLVLGGVHKLRRGRREAGHGRQEPERHARHDADAGRSRRTGDAGE